MSFFFFPFSAIFSMKWLGQKSFNFLTVLAINLQISLRSCVSLVWPAIFSGLSISLQPFHHWVLLLKMKIIIFCLFDECKVGNHVVLLKATFKMSGIYRGLIGYAPLIADTDHNLNLEHRTQRTSRGQAPPNNQNRRRWGMWWVGVPWRVRTPFSPSGFLRLFFRGVGA